MLRSNALPFIQRANYNHITGRRKGQPYHHLLDISVGKQLVFYTQNQSNLPDSARNKNTVVFKVTDVDEDEKRKLLFHDCKSIKDRTEIENFIKKYRSEERNDESDILCKLQSKY